MLTALIIIYNALALPLLCCVLPPTALLTGDFYSTAVISLVSSIGLWKIKADVFCYHVLAHLVRGTSLGNVSKMMT